MLDAIRSFGQVGSALLIGLAVGAAWMMVIVTPGVLSDRLDQDSADGHLRALIDAGSGPIAFLLLGAAALSVLAGSIGAGLTAALAALGFFASQWIMVTPQDDAGSQSPAGKPKGRRVMAVGFTLLLTVIGAIAGVLSVFGV